MRNPFPKHSHYIALIKSDISYSLSVDENALLIVIPAINSKPRGRKFPTKEINWLIPHFANISDICYTRNLGTRPKFCPITHSIFVLLYNYMMISYAMVFLLTYPIFPFYFFSFIACVNDFVVQSLTEFSWNFNFAHKR